MEAPLQEMGGGAVAKAGQKAYNHKFLRGVVEWTVSPYHQKHMEPLFKGMLERAKHRVTDNLAIVGPPVAFGFTLYFWANWQFEQNMRHHWHW
jgi:hypothetical protein